MKTLCTLITGGGEGLGRSFAYRCAARGHNLLLIALPGSRLDKLCMHIEQHFGVKCYWLEIDLCKPGSIDTVYDYLVISGLEVNMFINNAGLGHNQEFDTLSPGFLKTQLALNVTIPTLLIHRMLPMLKRSAPAHVINVSSMACYFVMPNKNTYSSSKLFMKHLSLSLRTELDKYNINVSVVCPSAITSNAYHYVLCHSANFLNRTSAMHPDDVAEYTLNKSLKGKDIIIPGRFNRFIFLISAFMPQWMKKLLAKKTMKPPETFIPVSALRA